jgi:glycosyltransferase involved in cell wall biosynthesis
MGGPEEIRGLNWLIKVSANALQQNSWLRFTILLRTNDELSTTLVKAECDRYRLFNSVTVVNGILPPEKVLRSIIECDFVVLPFILVPSEVPISILEAMKAGKPVVGTSIDGIPELIKNRGIVVKPGDSSSLEKAILKLAFDDPYRKHLGKRCKEYMKRYPKWEDSLQKLIKRLDNL